MGGGGARVQGLGPELGSELSSEFPASIGLVNHAEVDVLGMLVLYS